MDNCVFCGIEKVIDKKRIIYEDSTWLAILDGCPVSEGHTLLIPKRHCETYFDLNMVAGNGIKQMGKEAKFGIILVAKTCLKCMLNVEILGLNRTPIKI